MNTILEKVSRRAFLGSITVVVAALAGAGKPAAGGNGRSEEDLRLRRILSRYGRELGE
jgi:hypothetical protein